MDTRQNTSYPPGNQVLFLSVNILDRLFEAVKYHYFIFQGNKDICGWFMKIAEAAYSGGGDAVFLYREL